MSKTIVQINFTTTMNKSDYDAGAAQAAGLFAQIPGLLWKIWLSDEAGAAGGIYLFESAEAARAYVNGPIIDMLRARPDVSEVSIRTFGYAEHATALTRGPVETISAIAA